MSLLQVVIDLLKALVVIGVVLNIVPLLIYLERKICAYIQGRLGPNRVNFVIAGRRLIPGSLQPLADAIKLAFKEEIVPRDADKLLWYLGPLIAFLPIGAALAFIPFGTPHWDAFGSGVIVDLRVAAGDGGGILVLFAISSLAVYGIAAGGWGSGSKFPLMGAVRGSAQMISYEVALGLAVVAAMVTAATTDMQQFVLYQADSWGIFEGFRAPGRETGAWHVMELFGWTMFQQPVAALVFLVAMFAENNRLPFDLPECEPELIGGYHTEYSGLKFALFFLGEYAAMILMCSVFVTLFMGGWSFPGLDPADTSGLAALLSAGVFMAKLMLLLNFQLWIRWTLPRFRYDQLMDLGWKVMVPMALVNLVITAVILTFMPTGATA